ncbi:MAG: hypothetical protein OEQ39_19015 [Gammaproteobacteria bacterium]|nr:hypothetical protein [Gammaproteobacteria bacterium]
MSTNDSIAFGALELWTIYKDPSDYPGRYLVRRFVSVKGFLVVDDEPLAVVEDLAAARLALPPYATHNFGRMVDDQPHIVETWA